MGDDGRGAAINGESMMAASKMRTTFGGEPILARRFLNRQKFDALKRTRPDAPREPGSVFTFDIVRDGWTEFILVADDDPRCDTVTSG